jgi:hypothetical protein
VTIGVAISGGGHRASVWGWGALVALADLGVNGDVVSIASVSGGSIANGVLAHGDDYATMSPGRVEEVIAPGLRVAARDGLFFFGPATNGYIASFFAVASLAAAAVVALAVAGIGAGREWALPGFLVVGVPLALVAWAVWLRRGKMPARIAAIVTGMLLAAGPVTVAFLVVTGSAHGGSLLWRLAVPVVVTIGIVGVALRVFACRSMVVDRALARELFSWGGTATRLVDVNRTVHHVFCGTELQSGDPVYFTPRLVYGYRIGRGTPGAMSLSTAVQCSACLPGAFVARELATDAFELERPWRVTDDEPPRPPHAIVVNDGGVYDNMADQWEQGYRDRERRVIGLRDLQPEARRLVVVNAGKAMGWNPLRRAMGIAAEVRGLTRTVDILYDVSTSHRRQGLVARFQAEENGLAGCLVHIAQSPFTVPKAFEHSRDADTARRAREALVVLASAGAEEDVWEWRAQHSPRVPTVLRALGADVAADLLEHAFLLTIVNCYVILGLGALPSADRLARSRFELMVP